MNKKYFCYEVFKNLSVWSSNGRLAYSPCSNYDGFCETSTELDVAQAWNSPGRKHLIDLIDNDQPIPGCHRCYTEENAGIKSRRQSSTELYEQFHKDTAVDLSGPQGIDYSVGNLCNLKCVICGPANSTQWIPDYQKLHPGRDITELLYQKNNQIEITNDQALDNVINIHFHGGGEPLLSQSHVNLLKKIDEVKGLGDVRVFYNTNGTVIVNDDILKLWEKCKLIELYFSIDDIGQRFNYQRTNADFNSVVENLQWFTDNMPHNHMFKVNAVWSYLNLYYLDELVGWHKNNFSANRYGDKTDLIFQNAVGASKITHLSQPLKDLLLNKFSNYPDLLSLIRSLRADNSPHDKFFKWINQIDAIRPVSFAMVAPEWAKLLHDTL